ncbi:hypothetical protein [Methanobacterium alcaliphilum]|uniref:hypothetical protein n=1 Tax=Methanobacterium alcaliphilum TaxID=392018 RepID=UPI00200B185E|nr:hypothetical protein [Methanobacterium alcaliphilum]MCK9151702.1 hypothetical protein [Methanobacterium alcaliphilum]
MENGHGGDTITRKSIISVFFALCFVVGIVPASEAINNQESVNEKVKTKNNEVEQSNSVNNTNVAKAEAGYKYRYSKIGDCWAMSNHLYKKFTKSGKKVRIIQYRTKMSSRHRSIQLYSNGKWKDYSYKGLNRIYKATKSKPGKKVIKSSV